MNNLDKLKYHRIQSFTRAFSVDPSENRSIFDIESLNCLQTKHLNVDNFDQSITSSRQLDFSCHDQRISSTPDVPQCKANTSSDDDYSDECSPLSTDNSTIQKMTSKYHQTTKQSSNLNTASCKKQT